MITRTVAATDGISLYVEEVGNGQPVVFVQGLGYAAWGMAVAETRSTGSPGPW